MQFRVQTYPHGSHNDERRLHTTLENAQQETNRHQGTEVLAGGRAGDDDAPAEDICRKILGDGQLLEQNVGGIFSHEDAHVENGAEPAILLPNEIGVLLDAHDGGEG